MTTLTPERHTEAAFETIVEAHLLGHGYISLSQGYDCERAIFPDVALRFIQATQPKEWAKLEALHGPNTPARVLDDLCKRYFLPCRARADGHSGLLSRAPQPEAVVAPQIAYLCR